VPPRLRSISYKAIFKSTMVQTSGRGLDDVRLDGLMFGRGIFPSKPSVKWPPGVMEMESHDLQSRSNNCKMCGEFQGFPFFFLVSRSLGGVSYNDPCLAPTSTWRMGSQDGRLRGDEWKGWDPQP